MSIIIDRGNLFDISFHMRPTSRIECRWHRCVDNFVLYESVEVDIKINIIEEARSVLATSYAVNYRYTTKYLFFRDFYNLPVMCGWKDFKIFVETVKYRYIIYCFTKLWVYLLNF